MPTDNKESAFAGLEESFRSAVQENAPEVFTSDPNEPKPEPVEQVEKPEPEVVEQPTEEDKKPDQTLEEAISAGTKTAEEEAAEAKKLADEDAAKKAQAAAPVAPVHQDLEDEVKRLDPHTKPKTRQIIEGFKAKVIAERDRAVKAEQERAEFEKKAKDLETQIASGKPPKAIEDELTTLRERVRELDASKDPEIEAKYDKPILSNTDAAISLLGEQGLFKVRDGDKDGKPAYRDMTDKEKAVVTANIKNVGVGIRTMAQHIKALENAGEVEAAEQLRDLARENDRLARDKTTSIQSIKSNVEGRAQARTKEQQAAQEEISKIATSSSQAAMQANLSELAKSFPQITRPAEPLPTDSAAVVASKKAAIAAFDKASAQVAETAKSFSEAGLPPQKAAEVRGKMTAAAVESIILKNHVLPAIVKDKAALEARVKELEAQVSTFRKAGSVNRAHAASITAGSNSNQPNVAPNASFGDSLTAQLKAAGVDVNS